MPDTDNKGNKKARQINGLINEWYLEDMSENIKSVLTNRRQNGFHIGAFALYGYKKDLNQKGHLIIDEEAAAVVREVFTLFNEGFGKTAIARILNDKNIPNPTEYKRIKGLRYQPPKTKNSTLWKYSTISNILCNEIYIGNMIQGKYGSISFKTKQNKPIPKEQWIRVEGTHEPIIERELWDMTQNLLKQRAKPFLGGNIGLFSKKVKCKHCGYTMRSSKNRALHYLKCNTKHAAKDACIGSFIGVNTLEKAVLQQLRELISKYLDKEELEKKVEFSNSTSQKILELNHEINIYEKKIADYTKGIKSLYLDKVKGVITENEYFEFSKDFAADKKRLEDLLMQNRTKQEILSVHLQSDDNRYQKIEQYINIQKLDRETVDNLIDCIYISKRNSQTKELAIEIHWNF